MLVICACSISEGTLVAEVLENPANPHVLKAAMNFRGHLTGGLLAGAVTASVAVTTKYVSLSPEAFQHFTGNLLHWQGEVQTLIGLFIATLFMALFPDLDTASVPQRWFFRAVFMALIYLGWHEYYEQATLLGILSILPLLDHHRGWTHRKISPLLVPVLLGAVYEYWRTRHAWIGGFSWTNVQSLLEGHTVFLVACIIGWYTHLLLDGCLKFFPTSSDHH